MNVGDLHPVAVGVSQHYNIAPDRQFPFVKYIAISRRGTGGTRSEDGVMVWQVEVDVGR